MEDLLNSAFLGALMGRPDEPPLILTRSSMVFMVLEPGAATLVPMINWWCVVFIELGSRVVNDGRFFTEDEWYRR